MTHPRLARILPAEKLAWVETKFNRMGILFILLGRHLIGLRAQIFLASGVVRMPTWKFLIADAISSAVTIALMVGIGYGGANSIEAMASGVHRIEHIIFIVIIALVAIYFLIRYIRSKRSAAPQINT